MNVDENMTEATSAAADRSDDPIVRRIPVFFHSRVPSMGEAPEPPQEAAEKEKSPVKSRQLLLIQYPLSTGEPALQKFLHIKPRSHLVRAELKLPVRSASYHRIRGEDYMIALQEEEKLRNRQNEAFAKMMGGSNKNEEPSCTTQGRYLAALQMEGQNIWKESTGTMCYAISESDGVHLTPLDAVIQLRPTLHHLDALSRLDAMTTKNAKQMDMASLTDVDSAGSDVDDAQQLAALAKQSQLIKKQSLQKKQAPVDTNSLQYRRQQLQRQIEEEDWTTFEYFDKDARESQKILAKYYDVSMDESGTVVPSGILGQIPKPDEYLRILTSHVSKSQT